MVSKLEHIFKNDESPKRFAPGDRVIRFRGTRRATISGSSQSLSCPSPVGGFVSFSRRNPWPARSIEMQNVLSPGAANKTTIGTPMMSFTVVHASGVPLMPAPRNIEQMIAVPQMMTRCLVQITGRGSAIVAPKQRGCYRLTNT